MLGITRQLRRRAFTLAELLVVCAILALLVSTVVPVVKAARERARLELCASRIKRIGNAALQFEKTGVTSTAEFYFSGLQPPANVLPWRTLRALQLREDQPIQWADPLCARKLVFFIHDDDGYTPVQINQGLAHLYPRIIRSRETLYCPSSPVWTEETGWTLSEDGSAYITYCSREGAYPAPDGRVPFNVYRSDRMQAFLSCASFMGYQGHRNGWNVWFTDGHVRFMHDKHGVLRDLKAVEWFDVPGDYPPIERWSIWVHFDQLYEDLTGSEVNRGEGNGEETKTQ